jgi:hypothetical protein
MQAETESWHAGSNMAGFLFAEAISAASFDTGSTVGPVVPAVSDDQSEALNHR